MKKIVTITLILLLVIVAGISISVLLGESELEYVPQDRVEQYKPIDELSMFDIQHQIILVNGNKANTTCARIEIRVTNQTQDVIENFKLRVRLHHDLMEYGVFEDIAVSVLGDTKMLKLYPHDTELDIEQMSGFNKNEIIETNRITVKNLDRMSQDQARIFSEHAYDLYVDLYWLESDHMQVFVSDDKALRIIDLRQEGYRYADLEDYFKDNPLMWN